MTRPLLPVAEGSIEMVAVIACWLLPTPPSVGFRSLGRGPAVNCCASNKGLGLDGRADGLRGCQLPPVRTVSLTTRKYVCIEPSVVYVSTCRGVLTNLPPGVTAGLNWMVPSPADALF